MIAIQITSMKHFMSHLLSKETFDDFLLEEAIISTQNTFTIDGHINKAFFPTELQNEANIPYSLRPWGDLKGLCFDLIKGKYTPVSFKFVLHLKPEIMQNLTQEKAVKDFVLSIRYDNGRAMLTTAVSYSTFTMDKDADLIWDKFICDFLSIHEIPFEQL